MKRRLCSLAACVGVLEASVLATVQSAILHKREAALQQKLRRSYPEASMKL
jgi:hypothetical protein